MPKNLEYRKRQIQLSMLRAQWWIASAVSGHCLNRRLFHGAVTNNGAAFTDQEKLNDAMATAQRHIELAAEYSEKLAEAETEYAVTKE